MSRRSTAVVLSLLMAMSVFVPLAASGAAPATDTASTAPTAAQTELVPDEPAPGVSHVATEAPPDPDEDRIGWEDGYWHNESIDVDQSDGLTDEEIEKMAARAMARVEFVREKEFLNTTPVNVITREEYQERRSGGGGSEAFGQWNNQVWESLFVVGEDTDAQEALAATSGSSVAGFYSPTRDEITIVSDNPDQVTISPATLVHEYVHALQDQHFDLTTPRLYLGVDGTQDASLAVDGLVEGGANYVEARWDQRCGIEWSCLEEPESGPGGGGDINRGILYTIYNPYSDGPHFISEIVNQEGWEGVDQRYQNIPQSTEQVIHVTDDPVAELSFEDRSNDQWSLFPNQGTDGGADRLGEASIFVMFWANGVIDYGDISSGTDSQYDQLDYSADPSDGWGNDKVYPYKKGSGEDASYGYVWETTWDTEEDAQEFHEAYIELLEGEQAERVGQRTWVIPDGSFEDAFYVERDGTDVTIVNAPTKEELQEVRTDIEFEDPPQTTTEAPTTEQTTAAPTTEPTTEPMGTTAAETESTETTDAMGTTAPDEDDDDGGSPGPGVFAALTALVAALVLWRRRTER